MTKHKKNTLKCRKKSISNGQLHSCNKATIMGFLENPDNCPPKMKASL